MRYVCPIIDDIIVHLLHLNRNLKSELKAFEVMLSKYKAMPL